MLESPEVLVNKQEVSGPEVVYLLNGLEKDFPDLQWSKRWEEDKDNGHWEIVLQEGELPEEELSKIEADALKEYGLTLTRKSGGNAIETTWEVAKQ